MPMDFEDLAALQRAAEVHGFRTPVSEESEAAYRAALADYVSDIDMIEGHEIRTGKGWNRWSIAEKKDLFQQRA